MVLKTVIGIRFANWLARLAKDNKYTRVWVGNPPAELDFLVHSDVNDDVLHSSSSFD